MIPSSGFQVALPVRTSLCRHQQGRCAGQRHNVLNDKLPVGLKNSGGRVNLDT
jgi:hypothetical protein